MIYLLDTNVLIERSRSNPHPKVRQWFGKLMASQIVLCPVVVAEFMIGVFKKPPGKRHAEIRFLRECRRFFGWADVDMKSAVAFGKLRAGLKIRIGHNDLWLGAIASANGLKVATRNEHDFKVQKVDFENPWR